ncbi:MAG: hypothetical protein BWY93_01480 [Euryarchaeota archaeon ADurb.BinA087]|nr:MAG: hypothetical protein BWY93_01480 [Euryarchaeota archaeon ADurb.BinA087]
MTKTDNELIREYQAKMNAMNAFVANCPLRVKAEYARRMKEIRDELRTRGLYEANCGQFVTIPVE